MTFSIAGLGTAVPPHCVTQTEALKMSTDIVCTNERQRRLLRMLFRRSGINRRYTVLPHPTAYEWVKRTPEGETCRGPTTRERMQLYADHAPLLAIDACRSALKDAELAASDITHLITVSCTGFDAPGVDSHLFPQLGLRPTTERIHVGYMGCHGAINGLRAARGVAASEPAARVLMCAVELCSLHYRLTWDDEGIIGNALFADGAAAIVGMRSPGKSSDWTLRGTGSCLLPDSEDSMTWRVGNHGFEMRLTSEVPDRIGDHLRPWLTVWLDRFGLSLDHIEDFAVHPGGPRILEAVQAALELPREKISASWGILSEFGNMSSPTILFILERLRTRDAKRPCLALGFGPGLVAEVALFD